MFAYSLRKLNADQYINLIKWQMQIWQMPSYEGIFGWYKGFGKVHAILKRFYLIIPVFIHLVEEVLMNYWLRIWEV